MLPCCRCCAAAHWRSAPRAAGGCAPSVPPAAAPCSPGRQVEGGHRVEEAGGQAAQAAVAQRSVALLLHLPEESRGRRGTADRQGVVAMGSAPQARACKAGDARSGCLSWRCCGTDATPALRHTPASLPLLIPLVLPCHPPASPACSPAPRWPPCTAREFPCSSGRWSATGPSGTARAQGPGRRGRQRVGASRTGCPGAGVRPWGGGRRVPCAAPTALPLARLLQCQHQLPTSMDR